MTTVVEGGQARVALDGPPANALSLEMLNAINEAMKSAMADDEVKGIVLTAAKPGIFCAGLDITAMYGADQESATVFWRAVQDAWLNMYTCPKPVVSAINGHAPAGGCLLAICTDHRVMGNDGGFAIGLNETQLGIVAPPWFARPYADLMGQRNAERHLCLGSMLSADDALAIGLVDDLVPTADVVETAHATLAQYIAIPAQARAMTKAMMREATVRATLGTQEGREADLGRFLALVLSDPVQASLGKYLKALSKRKSKSK